MKLSTFFGMIRGRKAIHDEAGRDGFPFVSMSAPDDTCGTFRLDYSISQWRRSARQCRSPPWRFGANYDAVEAHGALSIHRRPSATMELHESSMLVQKHSAVKDVDVEQLPESRRLAASDDEQLKRGGRAWRKAALDSLIIST